MAAAWRAESAYACRVIGAQEHHLVDFVMGPGELSFEARIGDRSPRVWIRTESELEPTAEAALPMCTLPAMRFGGKLSMPESVSPRLLRGQREFLALQGAWSRGWEFNEPQLAEIEVVAPTAEPSPGRSGRVATFFSGGVDSWSSILDHPEVTDLIFVRGFDLMLGNDRHAKLVDDVEARLREAATELGLPLHVVETNLRELSDPLVRWDAYFGAALTSVTLFLAPLFERVLLATDADYEVQEEFGVSRLATQLWSTEHLEIVEDGGRYSRLERLRRIASHPVVGQTLRVCWENPDGAYNCGRCSKCLLTMVSLEALGMRERIETFPEELDLSAIADIQVNRQVHLTFWEDILDAIREAERADLEPAVEEVVMAGKRRLELPVTYRRRHKSGPAPLRAEARHRQEAALIATESNGDAAAQLSTLRGSRSWRMTAPLRALSSRLRRLS